MTLAGVVEGAVWEDDYNRNAVWCRHIVEELVRSGVEHVLLLCPGGRSAALALQIYNEPRLRSMVHADERSGAFVALGITRVTGKPVAVCTTSGSAVANLLPALCEADPGGYPIVVLTCDRSHASRVSGAPQTTDHVALCRPLIRAAVDLPDPTDAPADLAALRRTVTALVAAASRPGAEGPVHLNVSLEGEYETTELDPEWSPDPGSAQTAAALVQSFEHVTAVAPVATPADVDNVAAAIGLRPGMRGLIVAGPDSPVGWTEVDALARLTAFPVIADAYTGLRAPAVTNVVCEAEALVFHPELGGINPEVVVRLGAAPLGQTVHRYLAAQTCPVIRIAARAVGGDFLHPVSHVLCRPDATALATLGRHLARGSQEWLELWLRCCARARRRLREAVAALPWSESLAAAIACRAVGHDFLHLGNSMPVRHGNQLVGAERRSLPVYANRGVNGIDGTIGTFLGELRGSGARGLLLIGDLATLHDLPALAAARSPGLRGAVLVIQNGGGALFDLLPMSRLPGYEPTMRNPPHFDLGSVCAGFHLPFQSCDSASELTDAIRDAASLDRVSVVEAVVPAHSLAEGFMSLYVAMLS